MRTISCAAALLLISACGSTDQGVFPGTVEIDQVRISSRVSGHIEEVAVREGDIVARGDLLVRLDEAPFSLELSRSQAALASAEAGLETLMEGARSQEIAASLAALREAEAVKVQTVSDLQRITDLAEAGAVSDQQLQAASTAAVQAESRYGAALQSYSLIAEGARATEIEAAAAAVDASGDAVEMALLQLGWTSVTSPVSGMVTSVSVLSGENVSAGITLLTVAENEVAKVIFYIPEPMLGRISPGDAVTIRSDGGDEVSGTITFIAHRSEFTPSTVETRDGRTSLVYRTEAQIPNAQGVFKGGMPVDVILDQLQ